jgi:hypothetical protein
VWPSSKAAEKLDKIRDKKKNSLNLTTKGSLVTNSKKMKKKSDKAATHIEVD